MSPLAFRILESDDRVVGEDDVEDKSEVEEPAMSILQDQWRASLTGVFLMWLGNGASRW